MNVADITGSFVEIDSKEYYKISNTHLMPAFFINIASSSDVYMFLSSNGGLTAGRKDASRALFPYETDDRLHLSSAGPKTVIHAESCGNPPVIWEPFDRGYDNPFKLKRNIYKSVTGGTVLFEEINETLGLTFSYKWDTSEKFGIVRTSSIKNHNKHEMHLSILDGLLNVMPYGIPSELSDSKSCLTDAYKSCELNGRLAIYSLTTRITDTPAPEEILNANVVWCTGCISEILLSERQLSSFCAGVTPLTEEHSVGQKGAYLTYQKINLAPGHTGTASHNTDDESIKSWKIIMDTCLDQVSISHLLIKLERSTNTFNSSVAEIEEDIERGATELVNIVAMSDGLQYTNDRAATAHHFMNVLYNNMRGGVFLDGYEYSYDELIKFVWTHNKTLVEKNIAFFEDIKASADHSVIALKQKAFESGEPDLIRLCLEFLPLCFSRRHGDPSRPWNKFFINIKDENGNKIYHYEGNWRDIFQNWEAMSLSFPDYLENVTARFLNASTADGFNPYRINTDGIDWEVPEPQNPFSGYGYWGDHQIVYLLRLLESLEAHDPNKLERFMTNDIFCYADVPYIIKPYETILADSKDTIIFDYKKNEYIDKLVNQHGTDGKLMMKNDTVCYVSFIEKLLVPVLAKLANLVPGGGIWMNTQRPEWNDANNSIVGNGLSMVTVYQLYRHLRFCARIVKRGGDVLISNEVKRFLDDMDSILKKCTNGQDNDRKTARAVLDESGRAYGRYRDNVYTNGFSGREAVKYSRLEEFFNTALTALECTIDQGKAEDNLYHSYNIMRLTQDSLDIQHLFPMLEGQTAVLGSGRLNTYEAAELVKAMENSGLYSPEHKTFYLYPIKKTKSFMEKNIVPEEALADSRLITRLIKDGDRRLVLVDADGVIRLHSSIGCLNDFINVLDTLKNDSRYAEIVEPEQEILCDIYETIFEHSSFTGRSGVMYKYEGIGSIYWHQNSKFLLSYQECLNDALLRGEAELSDYKKVYYKLRDGLGFNKEPALWGAFPLDPYSHTPYGQPAQQPGMTGQVKEEILTRYSELGVFIRDGRIFFNPALLRRSEFLNKPAVFRYIAADGQQISLQLEKGELAFTICQTPVVYRLADESAIAVYKDGKEQDKMKSGTLSLDEETSRSIFRRKMEITKIVVFVSDGVLE